MTFVNRIDEVIAHLKWTDYQLAKSLNFSPSTVSNYRSGRNRTISVQIARKFEEYLGVPADWIKKGVGEVDWSKVRYRDISGDISHDIPTTIGEKLLHYMTERRHSDEEIKRRIADLEIVILKLRQEIEKSGS